MTRARRMVAFSIEAEWIEEDGVWLATSKDVTGLVVEAETLDLLKQELQEVIPALIELNGIDGQIERQRKEHNNVVPFTLHTHQSEELALCM